MRKLIVMLAGAAGSTLLPGTVAAQEYCVVCTQPQAVYRCVIADARPVDNQPLQLMCISTMAREGGHASCAARGGTVFECDGPIKRISVAAPPLKANDAAAATGASQTIAKPGEQAPTKADDPAAGKGGDPTLAKEIKAPPKHPPQTVEQLAKQIAKSSGEQVEKAGRSIGSTARKAWTCVTSLFTTC
jgi:hypothetical protein